MAVPPHETLTAAADLLEQQAKNAAPGPWMNHTDGWAVLSAPDREDRKTWRTVAGELSGSADADWIAMMSPSVAAPLAAWLRADARRCRFEAGAVSSSEKAAPYAEERYAGALGFARLVLGGADG